MTVCCTRLDHRPELVPVHQFGDCCTVDVVLLNDLVAGSSRAKFYIQFDDFTGDPLPVGSVDVYRTYMRRSMEFVLARNERMPAGKPDHAKPLAPSWRALGTRVPEDRLAELTTSGWKELSPSIGGCGRRDALPSRHGEIP